MDGHMLVEESKLFPMMEIVLDEKHLHELSKILNSHCKKVLTHPHIGCKCYEERCLLIHPFSSAASL